MVISLVLVSCGSLPTLPAPVETSRVFQVPRTLMWRIIEKSIPWKVKHKDESIGFIVYATFYGGESITLNLLIEEATSNSTKVYVKPTFSSLTKLPPGKAESTVLQMLSAAIGREP